MKDKVINGISFSAEHWGNLTREQFEEKAQASGTFRHLPEDQQAEAIEQAFAKLNQKASSEDVSESSEANVGSQTKESVGNDTAPASTGRGRKNA